MIVTTPKLRDDLEFHSQDSADGPAWLVKDPVSGRFLRLGSVEAFLARQLDGVASLETVRLRVEERFGAQLPQEALDKFVRRLDSLGLLVGQTSVATASQPAAAPGRVSGSLLQLRFRLIDPDRFLNWLDQRVRWFFTSSFVWFNCVLIAVAAGLVVANWVDISREFVNQARWQNLPIAMLTVFVVILFHELAHGLACKRFGGKVNDLGFLLLYFQPAFYCNVSDAWLFRKKSHRMWVTLAGPFFELFLWSLAVLAWRLTESGVWIHTVALAAVVTSGVKTLFNLNPLIKLDGYYLLSDYLEVTNLRERSFRHLGAQLKGWLGAASQPVKAPTAREARIYLSFGLLAAVYSLGLIAVIAWQLGAELTGRYQAWGFILFCVLAVTMGPKALRLVPAQSEPAAAAGTARPRGRKWAVLALLIASAGIGLHFGHTEQTVVGDVTVLPAQRIQIRAEVAGFVEEILVEEGAFVQQGTPIARLCRWEHRTELAKVEADIAEKRARLKLLRAGLRPEEIELSNQELANAQTKADICKRRLDELKQIHAEREAKAAAAVRKAQEQLKQARSSLAIVQAAGAKAVSRLEMEQEKAQLAIREQELAEAEIERKLLQANQLAEARGELEAAEKMCKLAAIKLRLAQAGPRPEEVEAAQAEISRLQAQRQHLERQLQHCQIVSPLNGVVATARLRELVGQYLRPGDLVAEVHELRSVSAEIAVAENDIGNVAIGQVVTVKFRAYPGQSFTGHVTAVAIVTETNPTGNRIIRVTTVLENGAGLLKSGMTGVAKIQGGQRRLSELATRRLANYLRVEFWSWW